MTSLPSRQVHLDFHTGPQVPDVGADFDRDSFAEMLEKARVNSVTLFAKCHHGHLYYETPSPARHPTLRPGFDLLAAQIEACHRRGIHTPIYLSVMCDEFAANTHPDWVAVNPDGTRVGRGPLSSVPQTWQILDMSSPYADYLADQLQEVLRQFKPKDGIFFDMCWDQPTVSQWALAGMSKRNLNPECASDRDAYARQVVHGYMERYNQIITSAQGDGVRVFYNSRPKVRLVEEAKFLKHVEVEALPTGGWGYTYFPLNIRFARNFDLPYIGMTGRFHRGWSDFGGIKPEAALKYECAQMLAHGAGCSIGDQMHPRGTLDPAAYELIGAVYRHVEACEPFCIDAKPLTEVAILRDIDAGPARVAPGDALEGAVRLLQQTFVQFDFIHDGAIFGKYRVLIVPNDWSLKPALTDRLTQFINGGGRVIMTGATTLAHVPGPMLASVGVRAMEPHRFETVYLRYSDLRGIPATDHVLYEPTLRLIASELSGGFGQIVEPYFDRRWNHFCGHNQTPPAEAVDAFAAVVGPGGAAFGFDLFKQYAVYGNIHLRTLFAAVMGRLLRRPLVKVAAPMHTDVSVTRQGNRTVVHVLSFAPQRRTPTLDLVEEATPLVDAQISLRLNSRPAKVTRQPAGDALVCDFEDGYARVRLSSTAGHDILVFE